MPKKTEFSLEDFLPFNLRVVAAAISKISQRTVFNEFGVSIAEWRVLIMVYAFNGISASMIADNLGTDRPSISRAVSKLIRKGHVSNTFDMNDRRQQKLELSESGMALCRSIIPSVLSFEANLTHYLSKGEVRELKTSLRKLQQALDEM